MPLVSPIEMLQNAQATQTAIGAFNIENMEMVQAVIDAAVLANAPIILQTTPSTLGYATPKIFAAMVAALAQDASIPIALHLDHGNSPELAMAAIQAGYTSVMYDGSPFELAENIAQTAQVVKFAGNIPVEGELGSVGGKEDDHEAENAYTNPAEAAEFVAKTGVGFLAIAIGTAHGIYSGTPVLDVKRLSEIRKQVDVPLVLHGASGLSAQAVRECVKEGICKVNFATELRQAYSHGVKAYLGKNPNAYDPKGYGKAGYDCVKELVLEKLEVLT